MTEYVVLLMGDAERWWDLPEEERTAGYGAHEKFSAQLVERGHRITGGAELAPAATSIVVRQRPGGAPQVTEGPFAETVEQLGGYYEIRTSDVQDLARLAGMLVGSGTIEIRPVVPAEEQPPTEESAS